MRIGNMRFWPSAVAGGFFILRGKRAGAKGEGKNPAVTALPCQGPLGKRALGTGEADCHDQFANWSRNDMVFSGGAVNGASRTPPPTDALLRMRWRRADVGSELSAASGRGSEVSEWPRSKF